MSFEEQQLSSLLESLKFLAALSVLSPRRRRQYVRQEHALFLGTRFRIFDEYLVTRRPEGFLEFIRLLPDEFEDLYERIGRGLEHARTHAGPISGRHNLMVYLRFVTQRRTFISYALDIGMGRSTVSKVVEEVTEAIIKILHTAVGFMDASIQFCTRRGIYGWEAYESSAYFSSGIMNYIFKRARQTIESTFGMLAQRFQILMTRLTLDPIRVKQLVISFMILHNLLPRRDDSLAGVQRHAPAPNSHHPLQRGLARESGSIARDRITQYYVDRDGPAR